jgi:hypothetical protein
MLKAASCLHEARLFIEAARVDAARAAAHMTGAGATRANQLAEQLAAAADLCERLAYGVGPA